MNLQPSHSCEKEIETEKLKKKLKIHRNAHQMEFNFSNELMAGTVFNIYTVDGGVYHFYGVMHAHQMNSR